MKRTLSLILATVMVLGLLSTVTVSVFAGDPEEPGATKITTAEEFAAMDAEGDYVLDADIEISASYKAAFKGSLDGAGHKITLNGVPAFAKFQGTVKNLTLEGSAKGTGHVGALAVAGSKVTAINVVNNASVTSTKKSAYIGGLIGSVETGNGTAEAREYSDFIDCVNNGDITFSGEATPRMGGIVGNAAKHQFVTYTRCVNNGKVEASGTALTGAPYVGGIASSSFGGKFIACVNNGDLSCENAGTNMGGMLGRATPSSQGLSQSIDFIGCVNNGNLTANTGKKEDGTTYSNSGTAGGILGHGGAAMSGDCFGIYTVENCINTGNIVCGGSQAGGIVGYCYGQPTVKTDATTGETSPNPNYQYAVVRNCINLGEITGVKNLEFDPTAPATNRGTYVSQAIGYTNDFDTVVENFIGLGKTVNALDDYNAFIGLSSDDVSKYTIRNCYLVEGSGIVRFAFGQDTYKATSDTDPTLIVDEDRSRNRILITDEAVAGKVKIVAADKVANGELVAMANEGAGATVFFQKGETVDIAKAITTAEEFYAMEAGGLYYLGADITIDKSVAFNGVFDGKGHTITTTAPLFENVAADSVLKVYNLTVEGEITVTGSSTVAGAICASVGKNCTVELENVTNKVNVTSEYRAGGLIGVISSGSTATIKNCVNEGNIVGVNMIGGLLAYMQRDCADIINCVNKGNVSIAEEKAGVAGGIVGRFGGDNAYDETKVVNIVGCVNEGTVSGTSNVGGIVGTTRGVLANITECVNTGDVNATINDAAGIIAHVGAKNYLSTAIVTKCVNKGTISNTGATYNATAAAAGIVAYCFGSGDTGVAKVANCINLGDIKSVLFASQIMGYQNNLKLEIKNCIGAGKLSQLTSDQYMEKDADDKPTTTPLPYYAVVVGCSSMGVSDTSTAKAATVSGLYIVENDGTEWYSFATDDKNAINRIYLDKKYEATVEGGAAVSNEAYTDGIVRFAAADLASGKVAYELNVAAGENVYFQNIGTDTVPGFDPEAGIVYLDGDKYTNTEPQQADTTPDEVTTPAPGDDTTPAPGDDTTPAPGGDDTTPAPGGDETTPAPGDNDTTTAGGDDASGCAGCGSFGIAGLALVIVLGTALIIKKK